MSLTKLLLSLSILLFTLFSGVSSDSFMNNQLSEVAVWDLETLNPSKDTDAEIGELLTTKVSETLSESDSFQVVERERLDLILAELNLSSSDLVDNSTRLKIGRIIGAHFMVFGGYFIHANGMRLDLRLVAVKTGSIVKATQKETSAIDLNGWLKIAQEAAQDLILSKK